MSRNVKDAENSVVRWNLPLHEDELGRRQPSYCLNRSPSLLISISR